MGDIFQCIVTHFQTRAQTGEAESRSRGLQTGGATQKQVNPIPSPDPSPDRDRDRYPDPDLLILTLTRTRAAAASWAETQGNAV